MIFSSFIIFMFIAQKTGQSKSRLAFRDKEMSWRFVKTRYYSHVVNNYLSHPTWIWQESFENATFGCCALKDTKKKNMITELFDWFNQVLSINETQNRSKQEFLQTFTTPLFLDSYSSHYRQAVCTRWGTVALYTSVVSKKNGLINIDDKTQNTHLGVIWWQDWLVMLFHQLITITNNHD